MTADLAGRTPGDVGRDGVPAYLRRLTHRACDTNEYQLLGDDPVRRIVAERLPPYRRGVGPSSSEAGPLRACALGIERDAVDRRISDAVQRLRVHPRLEERLESAMRGEDKPGERRRVGGWIDMPGALSLLDE